MGQRISTTDEVRQAIEMLGRAVDLLDLAGLGVLAARVHQSRELLEEWLAAPHGHLAADAFTWADFAPEPASPREIS